MDRFRELLDLVPDDALIAVAAEEELAPVAARLLGGRDHELPRRGRPPPLRAARTALDARARRARRAAAVEHLPGPAARVPRPERRHRRALAARRPSPSSRSSCAPATARSWPGRGAARPSARATTSTRVRAEFLDGQPAPHEPGVTFAHAEPARGLPRARAEARDPARAPAAAQPARRAPVAAAAGGAAIASFTELRAGGAVVHEDHGIARFAGFETKTVGGVTRDYLELEFKDGDRVFVPSDQLHKISRYVGADAGDPPLSKLGGKQWEQMKLRARRAARGARGRADQPLRRAPAPRRPRVPARRRVAARVRGALPLPRDARPDGRDRGRCRADMEEARPMDRLICGDVGYGKTEVALRAAFKAVERRQAGDVPRAHDGARPAALRHLHRAHARLPVARSRWPRASARRRRCATALTGFAEGKVDILIGTHRLLSRDVRPKDLGLLIVDEEQRFGVKQKELLRQLRLRVDVLSLSATPIPRTLQMSLAGPARHLGDRDAARGPPPGEDLRRRLRRGARAAGDRARAGARGARPSSCTTAWRRSTRPPSACARWCPKARVLGGARPDGREASSSR